MKKIFLFYVLFLHTSLVISEEYLYPIANFDETTILMMHQRSLDDIELLSFDINNHTMQKLLSSLYLPTYVKLIPGKSLYSFIDRGAIYIKDFFKRTPRRLDIYQPIFDIQSLQWINDQECVFSAKYRNRYKIFMYNINKQGGSLYALCNIQDDCNYIFPSFSQNALFCLMQEECNEFYNVCRIEWHPILFDQITSHNKPHFAITVCPIQHIKPLCFLTMHTQHQGYVLEIIEHNQQEKLFTFGCCKINISTQSLSHLFEFTIPEEFIIGKTDNRFFESLYPLLPRYEKDMIYFTTYNRDYDKLVLYQYDLLNQDIIPFKIDTKNMETRHTFAPLILNNQMYLGHNIQHN